jgi:simple sugar transport system permease protein
MGGATTGASGAGGQDNGGEIMTDILSTAALIGILTSAIRLATPYLYAAIGEAFVQTSGVLNLGVDGIMLVSGYAAFYVVLLTGNLWLGLLVAIVAGLLMGLLMSFISVTLKAEQGISGIGLYIFGLGLSSLLFKVTIGTVKTVVGFQPVKIPLLGEIPLIGPIFFQQSLLVYGAFLLVPLATWVLNKTTLGLKIRAVGQNAAAADSLGVDVNRIRYLSVCLGGALAGVAGASLSISLLNLFQENMTAGMGFIAVALVYFGGWRPLGIMWGALLFSTVNAVQLWMQVLGVKISSDVAVMLPYLLTIAALVFAVNRARQPAALNVPFERGTS